MKKRILTLLLALCLLLLCACAPQGGAEQTGTTEASTEATATEPATQPQEEVAQKPDFSDVNELEPNEKGVYQIHSAEGLANMAKHPDGKFELLWDVDMEGAQWTPVGTEAAPFTGSFDGKTYTVSNLTIVPGADGNTGFFGVNNGTVQYLRLREIQLSADSGNVGALAGQNAGTLEYCSVTGSMQLSGNALAGGLVGKAHSGTISGCETGVRMEAEQTVSVGLLAGELKNVTVSLCTFSGPMNLKGDTLFTNLEAVGENVTYTDCLWRDNTNSTELLDEEAQKLRSIAEQRMREQGTIEWTVDTNLSYLYPTSDAHNQYFVVGETYHGVPYTGKCSSLNRFRYCFNEDGTLKDFVKKQVVGNDNYDMYMGVDCSGAIYWSWVAISPSTEWQWTNNMLPSNGNGGVCIGGYVGGDTLTDTMDIYELNGEDVMLESFAALRKGDAVVAYFKDEKTSNSTNHVKMMAQDPVILRNAEGKIDVMASYVITHEQGDGLFMNENCSWMIDRKTTINSLMTDYYVPISNKELQEGTCPECYVTIDNDKTGKAYMATGTVESNYRLDYIKIEIKDEAGQQVWEKTLFTPVDKFHTVRSDYAARKTARTFNLATFGAYMHEMELETGKTYTYELTVVPATGESYLLKTFTFVQ